MLRMLPFTLPVGSITRDAYKALLLQLDPDDNEAEQAIRMGVERRATREMAASLEDWLRDALEGISEFEVHVLAQRLRERSMTFRDILQRALVASTDLGVNVAIDQFENVGLGMDWTLANAEARDWARRHTDDVLRSLNTTNDRVVGEAVARWIDNSEPLETLASDLTRYFGRSRAELIASTEVTRAFAEGNRVAYQESGVVEQVEIRTSEDERVCPVCGPLAGTRHPLDTGHPELGFHPFTPVVVVGS